METVSAPENHNGGFVEPGNKKWFCLDSSESFSSRKQSFWKAWWHANDVWPRVKQFSLWFKKNPLWVSGLVFIVWRKRWRHLHTRLPGWDTLHTAATSLSIFYAKLLLKHATKIPIIYFFSN